MDNDYLGPIRRPQRGWDRLMSVWYWLQDNWTLAVVLLCFAAFGIWVMLAGKPVQPKHYGTPRVTTVYCYEYKNFWSNDDDSTVWADPVPNP